MTATETRSRSAGGRSARQALRSAPLSGTMRPVRPGLPGGTYNPLTEAGVARVHQAAMDAPEQIGLADAPPSGVAIVTPPALSPFSFRHAPAGTADLDAHNRRLVDAVNADVMVACDAIGEIARGLR